METLKKIDRSRLAFGLVLAAMYALMLALNHWTPYLVDDYAYMNRWDNGEALRRLADVIPSMKAHSYTMNGRLLAHGLEQVFLLMPKTVFDLVNAGVFVLTILETARLCLPRGQRSSLLLLLLFVGLWMFLPVFGQVCLWQVGSLNYLWALTAGLLFLRPFVAEYRQEPAPALWKKLLFTLLAFAAGTYTEITSLICILVAAALTVLCCLRRKKPVSWLLLPLAAAVLGYVLLMGMPAESANKAGSLVWKDLAKRMIGVSSLFTERFTALTAAWAVLLVLSLLAKVPSRSLVLSLVFFLGAAAANYELIAAAYIPERCLCTTALLLLIACGILVRELAETPFLPPVLCAVGILGALFLFTFTGGVFDVYDTRAQFTARELRLLEQKRDGATTVYVTHIQPATQYSPAYGLKELDKQNPNTWPNTYIAKYYQVDRVVWVLPEPETGKKS